MNRRVGGNWKLPSENLRTGRLHGWRYGVIEGSRKTAKNNDIIWKSSDEDEEETESLADFNTGTEVNIVTAARFFSMFG